MTIKFMFDFHDIFVDAKKAWHYAFQCFSSQKEIFEEYRMGVSRKEICKKYGIRYDDIEEKYREVLEPIEKNIRFAIALSENYDIDLVSMSNGVRLRKDLQKFSLKETFTTIYSQEDIGDLKDFLNEKSKEYDWLVFFNHTNNDIVIQGNIIYMPIDFQGDISKYTGISFTEHARHKLLYNELSNIYIESISNDTLKEIRFLDEVISKYSLSKEKSVLDCCCGVGRHTKGLADLGYDAVGVDISKSQIHNAKKTNSAENIEYLNMDVRDLKLAKKNFGATICMWTTYNYLSEDEDLKKFIRNVYMHLDKAGILILDAKNIPALDNLRVYNRTKVKQDFELELMVCKRIIKNVQNSQYFYFIKESGEKKFYFDEEFVRFYYLSELQKLIKPYFDVISVFGNFDREYYKEKTSERFITILRKRDDIAYD